MLTCNVPVNSKTAHPPPPPPPWSGQTPGHLTFLKNFGQIPHSVGSLDGQMPHWLEFQRASNPQIKSLSFMMKTVDGGSSPKIS